MSCIMNGTVIKEKCCPQLIVGINWLLKGIVYINKGSKRVEEKNAERWEPVFSSSQPGE